MLLALSTIDLRQRCAGFSHRRKIYIFVGAERSGARNIALRSRRKKKQQFQTSAFLAAFKNEKKNDYKSNSPSLPISIPAPVIALAATLKKVSILLGLLSQ